MNVKKCSHINNVKVEVGVDLNYDLIIEITIDWIIKVMYFIIIYKI